MAGLHGKKRDNLNINMAGPETNRTNLKYNIPLPVEGAPVYFGGPAYSEQHQNGFSPEETRRSQELARHSFDSASAGEGRVQNWEQGVPQRNQQGMTDELDSITSSAIIGGPTLSDRDRNQKTWRHPFRRKR
jgi:hypothetical protein